MAEGKMPGWPTENFFAVRKGCVPLCVCSFFRCCKKWWYLHWVFDVNWRTTEFFVKFSPTYLRCTLRNTNEHCYGFNCSTVNDKNLLHNAYCMNATQLLIVVKNITKETSKQMKYFSLKNYHHLNLNTWSSFEDLGGLKFASGNSKIYTVFKDPL